MAILKAIGPAVIVKIDRFSDETPALFEVRLTQTAPPPGEQWFGQVYNRRTLALVYTTPIFNGEMIEALLDAKDFMEPYLKGELALP